MRITRLAPGIQARSREHLKDSITELLPDGKLAATADSSALCNDTATWPSDSLRAVNPLQILQCIIDPVVPWQQTF